MSDLVPVPDSLDERAALLDACADYARALEFWQGAAAVAEAERDELDRRLRDSEIRRVELEGMYAREVAAACTARAAVEASRGNR